MRLRDFFKQGPPLAYPYYFIPVLLIALTGFGDSVYLSVSHYRIYMDMGYQSFCAISRAFNCDTVSQSAYSIFLNVPVPVWGVFGYGFILALLAFAGRPAAQKKRVWTLILLISGAFSAYSVVLALISSYLIGSYCIMCILSYAVNLGLLFYAWIIRRRFGCEPLSQALKLDFGYLLGKGEVAFPVASVFGVTALFMVLAFPPYWRMAPPPLSGDTPTGVTEDGHPWIGAPNPKLEIVEFSDYMCFQCRKMHFFLRRLVEAHPDDIRLVHRHFPMDHEFNPFVKDDFHVGAGRLALIALYAQTKGKFWQANDFLFSMEKKDVKLKTILDPLGLDAEGLSQAIKRRYLEAFLMQDIYAGLKLGIVATPSYVIDGEVHVGTIPADLLDKAIQQP
ncbi:MAG: vitamin K epoxide reductase family protein [Thermodesulfobacteriota bacterium]